MTRRLVPLRQLVEDEGLDPDNVYIDPDDLAELDEDTEED